MGKRVEDSEKNSEKGIQICLVEIKNHKNVKQALVLPNKLYNWNSLTSHVIE